MRSSADSRGKAARRSRLLWAVLAATLAVGAVPAGRSAGGEGGKGGGGGSGGPLLPSPTPLPEIRIEPRSGAMPGGQGIGGSAPHVPFTWVPITFDCLNTTRDDETKHWRARSIEDGPLRTTVSFGQMSETEHAWLYQTSYATEMTLPPNPRGGFRHYRLFVFVPRGVQSLSVTVPGRYGGTEEKTIQLKELDPRSDLVWAVGGTAGRLGHEQRTLLRSFLHRAPASRGEAGAERVVRGREVLVGELKDLPDEWLVYDGVRLVVLEVPSEKDAQAKLTEAQLAALTGYVHAGGHLVVAAGANYPAIGRLKLESLLGLHFVAGEEGYLKDLAPLAGQFGGLPPRGEAKFVVGRARLVAPPEEFESLIELEAEGAGAAAGRATRLPVVTKRRVGLGTASYVGFSLAVPEFREWGGREALLKLLADAGGPDVWFHQQSEIGKMNLGQDFAQSWQPGGMVRRVSPPNPYGPYGPYGINQIDPDNPEGVDYETPEGPVGSGDGLRYWISRTMDLGYQIKPDSPGAIAFFLGLYVLLLIPANFLLFNRLRRRELAWLLVPVLALGFAFFSYVVGWLGKEGALGVSEVSLVHLGSGSPHARALTFLGFTSSVGRTYRFEFIGPQPALRHLELVQQKKFRELRELALHQGESCAGLGRGRTEISALRIDSRSLRLLEGTVLLDLRRDLDGDGSGGEAPAPPAPAAGEIDGTVRGEIFCDARQGGAPRRAVVRNQMRLPIRDAVLATRSHALEIGDLAPGARAAVGPEGAWQETHSLLERQGRMFHGRALGADENESELVRKGRQVLWKQALDEIRPTEAVLLGWIEKPLLHPTFGGRPVPITCAVTLLAVRLPVRWGDGRLSLAGGAFAWRRTGDTDIALREAGKPGPGGRPTLLVLGLETDPNVFSGMYNPGADICLPQNVEYEVRPNALTRPASQATRLIFRATFLNQVPGPQGPATTGGGTARRPRVPPAPAQPPAFGGKIRVYFQDRRAEWQEVGSVSLSAAQPAAQVVVFLEGERLRAMLADDGVLRLKIEPKPEVPKGPGGVEVPGGVPENPGLPCLKEPEVILEFAPADSSAGDRPPAPPPSPGFVPPLTAPPPPPPSAPLELPAPSAPAASW